MFVRVWRGIAHVNFSDQYLLYLRERVVPACRAAEGNRGIFVLLNVKKEFVNFLLLSLWESRGALDGFADPQLSAEAGREPLGLLLTYEAAPTVYEVINLEENDRSSKIKGAFMKKRFVLIHGAWHGGWCWDGVVKELEKEGYVAEAPTLPGHQPCDERSAVKFEDYVSALVNLLEEQPEPVILVGHSSAGFLLQAAAPKAANKIAALVFLNAFILPNGKCQFDFLPAEARDGMRAAAKASPDNCIPVMEDFVRNMLMAGDPIEAQNDLLSRLIPQPLALFETPVQTSDFEKMAVSKSVVFCKDDASLPPEVYLGMARTLGDFNFIEVDGSHEALFSSPRAVAEGLLRAIRE